jgi:hypothetical protein
MDDRRPWAFVAWRSTSLRLTRCVMQGPQPAVWRPPRSALTHIDQRLDELAVRGALETAFDLIKQPKPIRFGVISRPITHVHLRDRHRVGKGTEHFEHIDASVAHLENDIEPTALACFDPPDIVKLKMAFVNGNRFSGADPGE